MTEEKERLGERIRAARAEKGWKQKHLAAQVDVEPITVSRWERGATSPDLEVISQVAEATGKPLSYFVGDGGRAGDGEQVRPRWKRRRARIEAAALQITTEADRIASLLEELRADLDRPR